MTTPFGLTGTAGLRGLATLLLCVFSAGIPGCTTAPAPPPPNVIVILADDAGYADFGVYGSAEFRPPNIDALAHRGIRFTQGYVTASVCAPSRAGLITGRYQQRFGSEFNLPGRSPTAAEAEGRGVALAERTIADYMKDLGYTTAAFGKWHMGETPRHHPNRRGFDEFFGFLSGSRSYFPYPEEQQRASKIFLRNDTPQLEAGYTTDRLTDEAVSFIERHRDRPFFIYLAYNAVHTPMDAKQEQEALFGHIEDERRRKLAAMTLALDEGIGHIMGQLDDLGLTENTLVFFINDNGGARGNASSNGSLQGWKGDKFEGGIRVPFIVQWPGTLPEGVVYEQPVSSLDILPTTLAAAGGTLPGNLDGVNLLPYLRGEQSERPHETLFWRRGVIAAVRAGDWKLIRIEGYPDMLFNLADDPDERNNVIEQEPERYQALTAALAAWEEGLEEPRWTEAPRWRQAQLDRHTTGRERE